MKYEAKSSALQELVQLLMPSILEELNMSSEKEPMMEKLGPEIMPEGDKMEEMIDTPEIVEEAVKPKGMNLSITQLGLKSIPKKKKMEKKKKKGRAARRIK